MKHIITLLAIVGLPFIALSAERTPTPPLRVLTYNIHHSRGTDNKLNPKRIAEVIKKTKADLVALQEVDVNTKRSGITNQPEILSKLTGFHHRFAKAIDFQGGQYGVAILSRFPITRSSAIPLPASPGHEKRAILFITIKLPDQSQLTFASTHLDHTRDPANRIAQTQTIIKNLPPKVPLILAGDLNAIPTSKSVKLITNHLKNATAKKPLATFPSSKPNRQIDYILYRNLHRYKPAKSIVIDEKIASDHRPLLTIFSPITR